MYCPNCGHENDNGSFCVKCGARISPNEQRTYQPNNHGVYQPNEQRTSRMYGSPATEVTNAARSNSLQSLILGILSIALCFLCIGIVLGPLAIKNAKEAHLVLNKDDRSWWEALTGIITGGIGLGLSILAAFIWFVVTMEIFVA